MAERNISKSQVNILEKILKENVRIKIVLLNILLIFFYCVYSLLIADCTKNCENRLINKNVMACCMTCPWAPMAGGTTAQSGQRNDGVTAPKMQRLHQKLRHINRTLHSDIGKPTSPEKIH